jgi:hypothetical protein
MVQVRTPEPIGLVQGPERGRRSGVGARARLPRSNLCLKRERRRRGRDLRRARRATRLRDGLL